MQAAAGQTDPGSVPRKPVGDARPRTLYVSRPVTNAADIIAWAKAQGFETTLTADDLHVTIAYSRRPVDWIAVGESAARVEIQPGGPRLVEPLGDKGAVVLLFSSWELGWRHGQIREAGASWDWPEYQPHITLSYRAGGLDLETVEPYRGRIILGPERFEELDEDWSGGITEDAEGGGREAGRPFEDGKRRKRGGGSGNGRFNLSDHPRGPDGRWIGGRTADPRALKRFANQVQKSSQKRPPFEWVTVRDGRRVEAAVGVDTTGFSRPFDFDGVRHVLNRYGRLSGDRHKITPSEFRLVPRVLEHGMIVKAIHATKKHAPRVTYELSIRGRKYRVVEEIRRHKRAAVLKTFFAADD